MAKFSKMQDEELLKKVSEGIVSAYEELFHRHYGAVKQFLGAILKDMALAEDLAQEIFMRLWLHREGLSEVTSLRDYLFIASRNAALSSLRSKKVSSESLSDIPIEDISTSETAASMAELISTRDAIKEAMDKLPSIRGEVFRLSRVDHLPNAEIASRLGISVRTVEKHISLALRDLRSKIN